LRKGAVIRARRHVIKDGVAEKALSAIALDGPQRKIVAGLRSERGHPFEGDDDHYSLVETALAELPRGNIRDGEPSADHDAGREAPGALECRAVIHGELGP